MDEYFNWIAGREEHVPTFITPQHLKLDTGEEKEILQIKDSEGDLRFLLIEVSSAINSDKLRLVIESDTFYFNYTMYDMMNYNIKNMIRDIPSLILADPNTNRYIVMFRPFPPLHFVNKINIKVINENGNPVDIVYSLAYSKMR